MEKNIWGFAGNPLESSPDPRPGSSPKEGKEGYSVNKLPEPRYCFLLRPTIYLNQPEANFGHYPTVFSVESSLYMVPLMVTMDLSLDKKLEGELVTS